MNDTEAGTKNAIDWDADWEIPRSRDRILPEWWVLSTPEAVSSYRAVRPKRPDGCWNCAHGHIEDGAAPRYNNCAVFHRLSVLCMYSKSERPEVLYGLESAENPFKQMRLEHALTKWFMSRVVHPYGICARYKVQKTMRET